MEEPQHGQRQALPPGLSQVGGEVQTNCLTLLENETCDVIEPVTGTTEPDPVKFTASQDISFPSHPILSRNWKELRRDYQLLSLGFLQNLPPYKFLPVY